MHRLRMSAWPGDVYLKSHRPSCTFFGYIPGFGPPGALKSAIWRRFSIDFCRIRAPMRGHRKMACFSHISPHGRSKLDDAIGKQSTRSIDAKRSLSECSMDHPSTARSDTSILPEQATTMLSVLYRRHHRIGAAGRTLYSRSLIILHAATAAGSKIEAPPPAAGTKTVRETCPSA